MEAVGDVGQDRFAGIPAAGHQVGEERVETGDRVGEDRLVDDEDLPALLGDPGTAVLYVIVPGRSSPGFLVVSSSTGQSAPGRPGGITSRPHNQAAVRLPTTSFSVSLARKASALVSSFMHQQRGSGPEEYLSGRPSRRRGELDSSMLVALAKFG